MPATADNAVLVSRHDRHEDLGIFSVAFADGSVLPAFTPGQYATLGLAVVPPKDATRPKLTRRMYSIASPATQTNTLDFYITRVQGGKLTPSLFDLSPGDPLFMAGRVGGHFTLTGHAVGKTLVLVATGTGVAPFRSMLHTHRHDPPWDHLVLIEGCRYARDLGYRDELEHLAAEHDHVTYLPSVTREPELEDGGDWTGLRGRVPAFMKPERFEQLTGRPLSPETCHVYLCGNPAMIDTLEPDLLGRGFVTRDRKHAEGNLHFERYW